MAINGKMAINGQMTINGQMAVDNLVKYLVPVVIIEEDYTFLDIKQMKFGKNYENAQYGHKWQNGHKCSK